MANMSYCRFQNTLTDLLDCHGVIEEMVGDEPMRALSDDEALAARQLVTACFDILLLLVEISGEDLNENFDAARAMGLLNKAVALRS